MPAPSSHSQPPEAARFEVTRWSIVVAAGAGDSEGAHRALEHLCAAYWYPLYAFVRRQGHAPHDAQDLTQEFFARLLSRNFLGDADPAKGRFRSFLLGAMKHFLSGERDRALAQKRGGGVQFVPLDAHDAETRYGLEPADESSAEKIYEQRWTLALLEQVLKRLRAEFANDGREAVFDELKPALTGAKLAHEEIAVRLAHEGRRRPHRHPPTPRPLP